MGYCVRGVTLPRFSSEVAASPWARLVLAPVPNAVSRLRVLGLAAFRILHGRQLQTRGFTSMMHRDHEPCTNAPIHLTGVCCCQENYFAGCWDMMYSDRAVMVRLGLTPKLAGTTEPSAMNRLG